MLKNNADVKFQKDGNFREKAIETFLFDEHVYQSIVNFCDKNNVKLLQFFSALWAFQTGKSMGNDIVTIGNFDIENSFNYKSYEINMEQTIIDLINSKKDKSSTKLTELNFGNFGYNDFSGVVLYQLEKNRNSVNKGDFQLEIGLQQTEGKLKIVYNFDTDSISSMMLKLLHNRIEMICKQVMSRQAILLKDIEILHELEKQQVLIKYNETYSEYPNNKTIIELFEEQVNKTPNAIAIEFAGQELTYQQFNARTNYLGKLLREKGVGPDKIVAIITDRSIEMILGIFAVLKAGGAYLPIDPSQPIDRINYILEDSGTDILLSGHGADNVINNIINNVAIIDLIGCKEEIATNLEHISKQNHLAYVIYTSGTTGNPKGVMVENRNLMNLIYWMLKDDFKETEVIMQKTTYAFDLSIWEMFLWCIRGAKLFLLPKEDERDFQKIAEKIKKHNVTRLSFVPSVLEEFLFYTDVNKLTSLKRIQLSGEALPIELANKYNENYCVGANLVNSYGPTETTVFATSHMVPINEKQKGIHIGKPIANTQIYIMNNEHLCGVGMVGEIYIGGEGVTRGYLNKPQLTAEKFVENPFKPGDTVYRTGDLGRWLESGDIEYLGRIDDQVKVRGYRIELGEIKTKIREIEGIQNAAVVLKELDGEKYLCGYIVADRKMNVKKVKVQLEKKLPEYMIPTYIIQMESLPVTRNGKLDKNVLPNPKHISYEKYVAPRDETERYISGIFQEILRVNRVGIDDSFFELGGHSLRAIRLVNMLEQKYGTRIPLRKILENSTVRKLSEEVKRDANREQHVPIKKQPEKNYYEMSSAQKRLYVIDQMQEPNITYNIPLMIKFDEKINTKQLYNALTKLTERHELLRTHFEQINNKFIQVVEDRVEIDFSHIEEKSTEILNVYKKFIKPFDLKKAPLMRTMVIETEKNESILLIDIHHIIYDEGSAQILLNDLANFYNGKKLLELNIQYKDYSVWENARDLNEQKQYWLNEFSDEIPLLNLKTDFPRPQYQSYSGKRAITKLSKHIKELVRGVQVKTGATEYMIVLSTFMLLLNRYSRQEEIVIGSPVAGRTHVDTQDILGMFVNTLAIKGKLHPDMKYIELIQQLKEKCLRALENQDYPFEELVENIRVERDASRNPIFDVMFVLQNNESTELTFGKQKAQAIEMDNNTAKFDLTVSMTESEDGYELIWEYSTDLFKDETIERMSQHFSQLLTNTLKNPQKELCEFELLSEEERQKVLIEFNDTEVTYSQDKTIIELFEEQVERTPDNIALEFGQISLTYRELNSKANYLGEVLRKTGVKPDSVVGITSERSLEMVIGIYGILKSGAAYLPIDPKSPRNRMEFIIKDSNIKIMLGGPGSKDLLNGLSDIVIVDITECNEERESNLKVISKPNHLAYVIYTSGTTGMPKGVMIENRNIVNQVFWQIENGNYTEKSVIVQKTAFFFDGSAWEIFPCSVAGCKLSILNEDQNKDPGELIKFLPHNQIALTPSMLRMILEYIEDHDKAEVFQLINKLYLAAEPISKDLLERLRELMGGRFGNLCNLYGPTETTVTATSYHFSNQANIEKVPIGKPISNTQVYIMNGNTLCGIGVPGELCIAGAGVSRGYLNNPMLTAEKFVENPYKLGEKIYRTGDLACWLEDGNIEYLGRTDDQVKIRGFRIELGEIEEKIRTLPGIQDAVVVVKENNDEKYLCGYLVCKAEWNVSEIKMKLKSMLPDYMVPTYIMQIDKLPITRNGKLDKKALPCPEFVLAENYVAPRNKIESAIIEMYKEILHIEQVGIDNDFFELGGHSLKATVLVNSIERKFGMRIPLRKVMELKTVRNLAEEIKEVDGYKLYSPIEKQVDRHSFELTSAQKRLYIIDQMQGENIIYNTPQILEVNGYLDLNRLEKAFQKLIQRHDILRTHFIMENGTPIQKITDSIEFLLEFEVINKELDIQQLLNEFVEPFNLSESPLLRAKVVQITENKSILIIDIHHIICDGVSKKTLLGDLSKFYEGKYLATPEIQYKDYSVWENNRELFGQKNYWLNEFAEEIPVLDLITDNPRTQKKSFKGQNIITKLGLKYKNAIKQLEKETGATEYMVLLSTFMLLLSRYSRQEEIVVGSPISGRTHSDTIDMLGMFVNTLAIKGNIQSSQRFIDLVAQLREKCLNAFDNQEYPFEELVDQLSVEGDPSRNPIFDVMFAFQNNENEKITFGEADVVLLPTPNNVSKFDLTMNIEGIEDGYELNWEYCTDLFKEKTIARMNEQFVQLLKNALKDPQKKLCEIELLTDTEKEKVIYEFNRTHIEYQNDKTIIERFEEQVEKTPDKIAVEYEGESLTYRQLNAKANTIGKNLRDKGVHTESIVGIVTKRSLEMIVGIYGVLKAGGAYLPIDSEYPVERINFMLNDSKAKVLLVGEGNQSIVDHIDASTILVNLTNCEEDQINPVHISQPDSLAYVIYTSGTTGTPKGVMVENRNVMNLSNWQIDEGKYGEDTVVLQNLNYIFDGSVWEIFPVTLSGGKLLIISEIQNKEPRELLTLLEKKQALLVPSMFRMLLEYAEKNGKTDELKQFERLYLGAEPLTSDLIAKYEEITGASIDNINNLYGPTEATVVATSYRFNGKDNREIIPIGKPIANTQIYILNNKSICGIGMPGELCIGGSGVSRGYLNRAELTAEKFVVNPYRPNERIYRTGDLARWNEDGNIEYLGRIDEQVKIRGFRIELGEIEERIRDVEGISDAVVIIKENNGDKYLCGYVITTQNIDVANIKKKLGENLPEYMIPAFITQLERLPVTRSGKIDKKGLPEPNITSSESYVPPRDEIELDIAKVFQEILGTERVGIDDSFFELGGDSIKAIRIVSRLREYGYEINVRTIMQNRTIRNISTRVNKAEIKVVDQQEVVGDIELTPIQMDFFHSNLAHPEHFNQSIMLESKQRIDRKKIENTLATIVKHHDMLRAVFQDGKQKIKTITDSELYELQYIDLLEIRGMEDVYSRINDQVNKLQMSMDLEKGPLLKAAVIKTEKNDYLFLCAHHLVVDGVSWRILIEDINIGYNSKDGTPTLPSKTMSYKEWSNLLREYRNSHILKKEIPYWKQIEEKVKESLIEKISNEDKFNMEHIELALTQELTNKMLYKVSKAYNTEINDLLLTALSRAVNNVTGKSTVAVNMEGHGRETIEGVSEIDRTVGWFTSVYPVAISDIGKSIREDIRNTKETLRKVPNRGMGYGVLKRLGESVIEGVTPDITFNYLGEFVQENSHGNFVMSDLPCGKNVSDDNDLGTPISFNGAISNNVFHMIISYDKSKFNTENMELMKESFEKELIEVIEHCIMVEQCEHTASDFGELNWSDNEFALVKNKLQEQGYDIERIYPMTQMQEGMLYHKLHNEDSTSYVVQTVFQSNITINEKILKESFELLVAKHEVLRTNIVFKDVSDPRQVLLKDKEIEFTQIDLTEIENRQVELGKIREMDVRRGFDFEKESFLRVILVKLDEEDYRLIISFHHIIMDGWCLSILMNDLIWFYEQLYMKKTKSDLKESIQKTSSYEDYIRLTQNKDKEIALKYWTRLLEDYEEPAGIKPIGNRKNEEASEEVQRIEISLSKEETQKLEKMSNKLGVTVNTVIETAWGIILQRYNNTQDVIFGKVVSGRNVNLNGIEEMVGLFINMVPVRVKNQEDDSFSSIVSTLQEQALQTSQYDYSSLAEIQNCSILGNDLIQTMIAFENYHSEERNLNTRLNLMMVDGREQTNYALTLSVNQTEVLNLGMIFDTELFGIHEVKRILNRLSLILKSVIENPEIKVNNIELLNEEEKILVLNGFNSTKTEYPDNKTVVELFEEQVQKIPNEIAIGSEDQRITYHYLNERANQVARKLKKLGMEQNQFVAIMAERKIETIIGILGILKAGGAYLPIDPKQPIERVKYILKDSDAQFILATDINASLFNNLSLEKISLQKAALKDELSSNLNIVNISRDLAYLIYTSGTTGTPKGVMVEHRNINRLVRNADYVDFENVRILQTGSLAFDASTFEIWGALLNGGSLYLVDDEVVMNPKLLQQMISEFAINTMWFTTTLFNHLISSNYKIFDSLDQVLFGGEAASAEHVRQLIARNKKIKLCNGYGPTENTTFTACYPISNDFDGGNIPIGKPISNTQVYVLDNNKICGIGMPGELCVGGDGLSKGYLNRPELMKEKFINNPYNSSEIIYKTGDLVRWLEDGNLEYLGRIDEQVKIRGFRIELGEIENTIRKIEGIRDVSVIVNEEKHEKYLCAYVCYDDGIESRDILNYLKGSLPEYMIPTYIVQLEKLPITRNGKLDRRALPMPEHKGTEQYISPRNKIELVIAEAFQEILGIEQVGIDDSFFRLGGHSLRATRLVNKIEQKLGTRIPLRDVMEEKTVRRISQKLQQSTDLEKYKPIEKQPKKPSYEMSSAQKRLYAIDQIQGENTTYNMPGMMRVQGSLDLEKLQQTVNALIKRQEVLRTHFTMKNGQPVQIIEDNVELSVGYRKGNKLNIDKIYKDFVRPFDLNKAPLMRVQVVGISENESILMLDIHHIICDGGSIGVWFEEFSKIYNGEDLPELKVQYKDYSVWQNSNVMKEQKKYWLDEFSGELPLLNLQTDYPRPQKQSFKGNSIKTKLSSSTREAVKLISKETGATEYMVLLSTFMLLLSRYARTEEIIVGTPIAGRTHPETQNMLGMFVNTLAIKGDMQPNLTYLQLIEQLKEKCLKAYDNQEYPFEELIENLDLERDISRNPLFDVMFALQNNEESHLKLGNTKLEQIESESEISKFDLTVSMTEIESGYELLWEYCTDLFKQSTIERMGLHYSELLKNAVENPKRNIYDIPLMGYSEYKKVLEEFNITTTEFPGEGTIVELFEKQVEKTPEKVAVISNGLEYTFGYLNKRSNQLAHQLQKLQVQPNDFVGIWATRKIETIIGILAILKAGGAYLPIDPKQPIDRTRYMLRDSRAKVLLTEVENLPELLDGSLTVLNLKQEDIYDMSCENPTVMNQTTDLAYLIYTSGTTGEPKGVMVEHRNVIRLVKNTNYVNFHDVGILQTGSLAFDASTFEIWGSLLNGGRLYLVEQDVLMDVEALKQMLDKHRINTMFITTALFNQLVITDCTIFDSLDQLLFGGETTSEEHVKKLVKSNKKLKLSNVYGPTENTTFTTHYPICSEELLEKTPIGKPISNTTVHILNGHNLCGIGIPGELCVGGAGVARGYLNKAELTAEKFVVNPLVPEEKIYRTGDLARWLEDGNIEYLGRIDEQVKIRGFRIELGEIESKLREIPYIQDVAVTLIEKNNDKYLCGYVVSKQKIITEEIKNQLGKTLPQYMVPTYIVQLSALPMTQNRKVNKKELPIPDFDNSNHYVGPRDEIELCVARVFEEILGIERIGIDDSFFELGGDSIKAIRIVSKLRENGCGTDVRNILQNKTIRKICLGISKARNIIIDQSEVTGVAALTPIQIDFFNSQLEKPNHFNQSFMLESSERVNEEHLNKAITAIVEHHDTLRTVFRSGEQVVQSIKESALYDYHSYDYSHIQNKEELYEKINNSSNSIQASFEISEGPLVKVVLFRTKEKDYLLISIHHLVVDGVSWRIIIEDLNKGYTLSKQGNEVILPRKTMSFKLWSEALNKYRESESLKKEIPYWQKVERLVKESKLPTNQLGEKYLPRELVMHLSESETSYLLYQAGRAYNTEINDLLLTAVCRAVNKLDGKETVALNLEGHGREMLDQDIVIDRTVGWFTSVYPVAVTGIGDSITNDIQKTKEALSSIPNKGLGYGVLKALGENVLENVKPDITFNYLGELDQESGSDYFNMSDIPRGEEIAIENEFSTGLSINGAVTNKKLRMVIIYNGSNYSEKFMQALNDEFKKQLLVIIEHCIEKRKNEKYIENTRSHLNRDEAITQVIWEEFGLDSILKSITVEKKEHSVLFVTDLSSEKRGEIKGEIINKLSFLQVPDYIVDMNKYPLVSGNMEEEQFISLCSELENTNNISLPKITKDGEMGEVIEGYTPSIMQELFLSTPNTMIEEKIIIEGDYDKDSVIAAIEKVVQEQSILRSTYQKIADRYIICEHGYNTFWKPNYFDLRYATSTYITAVYDLIHGMRRKMSTSILTENNMLSNIVITQKTEREYCIYVIIHHSIWDKASNQIFKEKIIDILNLKAKYVKTNETYKQYVDEVTTSKIYAETHNLSNLEKFKEKTDEYVKRNINNVLEKSVVSLFKMGSATEKLYNDKPWSLFAYILNILARENKLTNIHTEPLPILILQEDRRYMTNDYSNTLGEFLDWLPLLIEGSKENELLDWQQKVNEIQNVKKENHYSLVELLNYSTVEMRNMMASVLSINYQGGFSIEYEEMQEILKNDDYNKSTEVFVNSYSNYLILSYPIFSGCSGDIEEVIQNELNQLEDLLNKKVESEQFEKVVIKH